MHHALVHDHVTLPLKSNRPSERVIRGCNRYAILETNDSHANANEALPDVVAYHDRLLAYGLPKSQQGNAQYMGRYFACLHAWGYSVFPVMRKDASGIPVSD
jgi:hypothetical protein